MGEMMVMMTHPKMKGMVGVVMREQGGGVMRVQGGVVTVVMRVLVVVDKQRYVQAAAARILPEKEGGEETTIFCGCSVKNVASGGTRFA